MGIQIIYFFGALIFFTLVFYIFFSNLIKKVGALTDIASRNKKIIKINPKFFTSVIKSSITPAKLLIISIFHILFAGVSFCISIKLELRKFPRRIETVLILFS